MPETTNKLPGGKQLINVKQVLKTVGIAEKMKIADLGCGNQGFFTLQAAKLIGDKGLVYAIDILKPALQELESIAKLYGIYNIKTVWADLEVYGSTKIPDKKIDIAMLNNTLFQTDNEEKIIKEGVRILKNKGLLLVVDWEKTSAPFGPPVENRVDPQDVKKYAEKKGLKLKKEFKAGPYHYGLIFKK